MSELSKEESGNGESSPEAVCKPDKLFCNITSVEYLGHIVEEVCWWSGPFHLTRRKCIPSWGSHPSIDILSEAAVKCLPTTTLLRSEMPRASTYSRCAWPFTSPGPISPSATVGSKNVKAEALSCLAPEDETPPATDTLVPPTRIVEVVI